MNLDNIKAKIKKKIQNIIYPNGNFVYLSALNMVAAMQNKKTFGSLKNCFQGKKVVLCGAGPSLNKYRPIEGALHIALNRALLYERVNFDWFIATDWVGIDFMQDEIINYNCLKFLGHPEGAPSERIIPESFRIKCGAKKFYTDHYIYMNGYNSNFIIDIDCMAIGNMPNIAIEAMQIALFTNPAELYIVGCDASQGHFKGGDKKAEVIAMEKCVGADESIVKWREVKAVADTYYPDTKIVSVNPVGLKGIFEDIYTI